MKSYTIHRIIKVVLTIWFVYTVVFLLTRVTGDPVEFMTVDGATAEAKEQIRINLGLNKPLIEQYIESFVGLFTGNSGNSYYYARPVSDLFAERLWPTVLLGLVTIGVTIVVGVLLGILAAVKNNTIFDRITMTLTIIGNTVPNFVLGIILIFIFSLHLRALPSAGIGGIEHLIMPVITMSVGPTAKVARLTRSSLLDTLYQDYLDTSRSKGMAEWHVIIKHGLRNALIPVITILGAQLSAIIGGSVVVETVFAWPGIGTLIVNAAQQRDFPVVVFGVLIISISVTVLNFLVDMSYALLDPKIRLAD